MFEAGDDVWNGVIQDNRCLRFGLWKNLGTLSSRYNF